VRDYKYEPSSDGVPYALIAFLQMGAVYSDLNKDRESIESLLELYKSLLEPAWSISRAQFSLYLKKVKDELDLLRQKKGIENIDMNLADRWAELGQIEKEKSDRMAAIETIAQKMDTLSRSDKNEAEVLSGTFKHLFQKADNRSILISYTSPDDQSLFGFSIDNQFLVEEILSSILAEIIMNEKFLIRIVDEGDKLIAGEDLQEWENPVSALSHSRSFEENFPPWMINIYQTQPNEAERRFSLRRNIYILSVVVVIVAVLFGGVLAIRSTAKELRLAKLKSEFVSTVSHEFRTPLTSIRYLSELLQRGRVKEENKKQQYYESITHESERLSRLIENILDFSKIEAGMKEYEFAETDASEMCRDIVSHFQQQVAPQKFMVESEIAKELPKTSADKEALGRALLNLLDNAVKYSGESRKIKFSAWSDQDNIYLSVEDKGIGMSKEDQDKVFEKFYRSEKAHDSAIKGSGIGLTLVSHIVKAHRGKVIIESDLGKGTKVSIILPIDRKA
jgi:signal transduction histidine kinase